MGNLIFSFPKCGLAGALWPERGRVTRTQYGSRSDPWPAGWPLANHLIPGGSGLFTGLW